MQIHFYSSKRGRLIRRFTLFRKLKEVLYWSSLGLIIGLSSSVLQIKTDSYRIAINSRKLSSLLPKQFIFLIHSFLTNWAVNNATRSNHQHLICICSVRIVLRNRTAARKNKLLPPSPFDTIICPFPLGTQNFKIYTIFNLENHL